MRCNIDDWINYSKEHNVAIGVNNSIFRNRYCANFNIDLAPCLIASKPVGVITVEGLRRVTPDECRKLQGFPENWVEGVDLTDTQAYGIWGNAISIPVAEYILKDIFDDFI